jgi:hypothetical protein
VLLLLPPFALWLSVFSSFLPSTSGLGFGPLHLLPYMTWQASILGCMIGSDSQRYGCMLGGRKCSRASASLRSFQPFPSKLALWMAWPDEAHQIDLFVSSPHHIGPRGLALSMSMMWIQRCVEYLHLHHLHLHHLHLHVQRKPRQSERCCCLVMVWECRTQRPTRMAFHASNPSETQEGSGLLFVGRCMAQPMRSCSCSFCFQSLLPSPKE